MKKIARNISLALGVCAVLYLCIPLAADAGVGGAAMTQGSTGYPENVKSTAGAVHVVPMAADGGTPTISGTVTMQGTTADGGLATPRLDGDRRQVVAMGTVPGPSIGANLTTTAAAGPTIPAGAEYLICALAAEVWLRFDGTTATADAPSIPFFSRQCRIVGPFAAETATSGILPAGGTVLAGSEVVAIPVTRPQ